MITTIPQVTVLVPNEPGAICRVTETLAAQNVDMRALSIADTRDYGILRLIVRDTDKAIGALSAIGLMAQVTPVIGVKISDEPGKLNKALQVLREKKVNLEYLYAFLSRTEKHAYIILRVADNDTAGEALLGAGFSLVSPDDIRRV